MGKGRYAKHPMRTNKIFEIHPIKIATYTPIQNAECSLNTE